MTLGRYFLISLAVFIAVLAVPVYFSIPILPFAAISLAGLTLLGFQVEDHRVGKFLTAVFKRPSH